MSAARLSFILVLVCQPLCLADFIVLQQGDTNGYAGTQDTSLSESLPGSPLGSQTTVGVQGPTASREQQGLLRFDDIFGNGLNQVPDGSTILSATLQLTNQLPARNTVGVYNMLLDWNQTSATWNSFTNGIQANGVEASLLPVASYTGSAASIDVTASLIEWSTGAPNYGWAFLINNASSDTYRFFSSDTTSLAARPKLTIEFSAIPEPSSLTLSLFLLGTLALKRQRRQAPEARVG